MQTPRQCLCYTESQLLNSAAYIRDLIPTSFPFRHQVPVEDFEECRLGIALDCLTMTGNHSCEIPSLDDIDAVAETGSVLGPKIPVEPLDPLCITLRVVEAIEYLVGDSTGFLLLALWNLAILFDGRQVEHEICLDKDLFWLVVEDNLLVGMAVDVFVVKVGVELITDFDAVLGILLENNGKFLLANPLVVLFLTLLL